MLYHDTVAPPYRVSAKNCFLGPLGPYIFLNMGPINPKWVLSYCKGIDSSSKEGSLDPLDSHLMESQRTFCGTKTHGPLSGWNPALIGTESTSNLRPFWMVVLLEGFHCIDVLHDRLFWKILHKYLGLFFSCDQAALRTPLSVCLSVCLSVRLSVCHTLFIMFLWSYHHKIFRSYYQHLTEVMSMQKIKVKGQGHRGHNPT